MYRHILVPLDGSPSSESVLPLVGILAVPLGATVTLIHIIEKNPPKSIHNERHLAGRTEAEEYLSRISKTMLPPSLRVRFHVHEIPSGDVATTIVAHEGELDYDLVVMSIHGKDAGRRFMFGNLAQRILALGTISVMFVKSRADAVRTGHPFDPILVPMDLNHDQSDVLDASSRLAASLAAGIELVSVVETPSTMNIARSLSAILLPISTRRMMEHQVDDCEAYLEKAGNAIKTAGIRVTHSVLKGGITKSILNKAEETGAGLIVMGTHGKTGTKAFWNASVSNSISSSCSMPVLLIPLGKSHAAASVKKK